ncbi:hypothetical protein [Streptomyces hesseae]|uniref:Uncharacterized protein n=1 Tax=Streptomyces hesseae TaxID=3075519 RepID=A0ABU2SIH0_9ACTN|nr:hypothetical protein [Streptomyces sp. DSM 40473]MDT0448772.1 hypothetical protein [Streptomyces sp. DSM 40473]
MTLRPLRLAATTTVTACLGALLALGAAGPAAAHGDTIRLAVAGPPSDGHIRTVATWDNDGDTVDERVAGTLTARDADGHTQGPWVLVPVPGTKGAYTTQESLPPGNWTVTLHCGFPDLGHGEAVVTVPAAPAAAARVAAAPAATPEAAKASRSFDGGARLTTVVLTAVISTIALIGGWFVLRSRRSGRSFARR